VGAVYGNLYPAINATGTRIAFVSDADPAGSHPEGGIEIFLFNTVTGITTQVTDGGVQINPPAINANGTRIALLSRSNLTASGGNDGFDEIFLATCTRLLCDGQEVTIVGTEGPDVLIGTAGKDVIHGLSGNDTIRGRGGNDVICGGNGRDTLSGGAGNDRLFGEGSNDTLNGGAGNDRLVGGAGDDSLTGSSGNDQLLGQSGDDQLDGGDGDDQLNGGPDDDICLGGAQITADTAVSCESAGGIE
jgi:Ca2+-binding RTX toxin-like protein